MTKLLFCGDCGDIVSMSRKDMDVRWCGCGRHAAWWENGQQGQLRVHDKLFPERSGGDGGKAWVIGLHNALLMEGGTTHLGTRVVPDPDKPGEFLPAIPGNSVTTKEVVEKILAYTPESYIFKRARSLVIRITPGYSNDTRWSLLPTEANR